MSRPSGALGRGLLAVLAAVAVGCRSKEPEGFRRFAPPPEVARKAVAAALEDWKSGRAPGRVAGARPAIQVVDGHREPERTLTAFAILGNTADESSRVVTARLTLDNPDERTVVRYRVLGSDPIWVIRQEDLDMITHWDCPEVPEDAVEGAGEIAKEAGSSKHDHEHNKHNNN